jgi:putative transposase
VVSKWVSDTKAVETVEGWLFVVAIVDLFSRMVVGWAMGADEPLIFVLDVNYFAYA